MTDAEYNATFNLPFNEASQFFRDKLNIPTEHWDDLWKEEHAKGFMSAGAQKAELLAGLREAVQKSIDGKLTLKEFRAGFDDLAAKHGWSYNGGSGWRSALIYDTNITTAFQAGRWQQFQEGGTEYLKYVHADGVLHPRPQHVAWNGLVLPIDHPFWKTHYPPNGWRCHCRAVRAERWQVTPEPAGWRQINEKTGEQDGLDKGWGYNVGEAGLTKSHAILNDAIGRLEARGTYGQELADQLRAEVAAKVGPVGARQAVPVVPAPGSPVIPVPAPPQKLFTIADPALEQGWNDAVAGIPDELKPIVEHYAPRGTYVTTTGGCQYLPGTKTIEMNLARGSDIYLHEFAHLVDDLAGGASELSQKADFVRAFTKNAGDLLAPAAGARQQQIFNDLMTIHASDACLSDFFCCLTDRNILGRYGHSVAQLAVPGAAEGEVLANIYVMMNRMDKTALEYARRHAKDVVKAGEKTWEKVARDAKALIAPPQAATP